ncbi:MAG TPA: hypothetical protein PLR20_06155 [Syntrophales bacterium]|jgi:hypothetical protein|nr:hypothetical protein [Syntrophales bacterium]HOX94045.1 hypothetical protein [Syntrophales bacterium]HPI57911.1 hypothetical protein [Syntrophales bacterium]HPN24610.1 hypothetical protein [Syntrophales bacterium]HQM28916.1 hypothetical protein [Syntrophales bacterium]
MNYQSAIWIEDDDRYIPGNNREHEIEPFELGDLEKKAARAREYLQILEERHSLGRGLIIGGIISVFTWIVLGVMLANILK